jgi:hypothetical protein
VYAYRNPPMPAGQMRDEASRAGFTTPEPSYVDRSEVCPPQRLTGQEQMRALAAMHHARSRYPGPVGAILRAEIAAYKDLGYVAQPCAPVRQLIDELMAPPAPFPVPLPEGSSS